MYRRTQYLVLIESSLKVLQIRGLTPPGAHLDSCIATFFDFNKVRGRREK